MAKKSYHELVGTILHSKEFRGSKKAFKALMELISQTGIPKKADKQKVYGVFKERAEWFGLKEFQGRLNRLSSSIFSRK